MYANGQRRKKPATYGKTTRNATFSAQKVGSFFDEHSTSEHTAPRSSLQRLPRPRPQDGNANSPKRAAHRHGSARDEFEVPSSDDDRQPKPTLLKPKTARPTTAAIVRTGRQDRRGVGSTLVEATAASQSEIPDTDAMPARKRRKTASPQPPSRQNGKPSDLSHPLASRSHLAHAASASARRLPGAKPSSPLKGTSAPARLTEMLSEMRETSHLLEETSSSPPSTPPAAQSPRLTLKRNLSTTPKQSHLWDQLLPTPTVNPAIISATVDSNPDASRRPRRVMGNASASGDSCLHGRTERRPRLVDRLKQDAPPSETTEGDDSDTLTDMGDRPGFEDRAPAMPSNVHVSFSQIDPASLDLLQGTDSQRTDSQSQPHCVSTNASQTASGLKLTYSRTRSYLQEDSLEDNLLFAMPTMTPQAPAVRPHRGGSRLQTQTKPKPLFDPDDESDDGTSKVRSIHELRAAGSKKRFNDDNQALLDDIKDHRQSSRSRRRGALMELASKLSDKTFVARFVELGFDRELAAEFACADLDPIADTVLSAVLVRMIDPDTAERSIQRLHEAGALRFATDRLGEDKSVVQLAKDRRNNMSKIAQSSLVELSESLRTCSLWSDVQPETLTTRLLTLKCMELMIHKSRRQGNRGTRLNPETVVSLVDMAIVASASADDSPNPNLHTITTGLALAALEGTSTLDDTGRLANVWSAELLHRFATALPTFLRRKGESPALSLRLSLNLTNNNATSCALFSDEAIAQAVVGTIVEGFRNIHETTDEEEALLGLDNLLLSLGLMINLAEFSDEICRTAAALQENGLVALVDIFLQGQETAEQAESVEQSHGNVAHGYLAVLLGNLCQDKTVRDTVRSILPGQRLEPLITAVEEFVQYHRKVDSQTFEGDESQDVWTRFTDRLTAVVARLRSSEQ
ncbi:hypothetical protein MBLNU459_g5472t1 [Dothideomycetes sp. NU459]